MREWQSQSHVRWYCSYHVVWVPKYRKRAIFGEMRRGVGRIVREWCQRHGVELVEGHALSDHVHVLLGIPPKLSVANPVGFLKGKVHALLVHRPERIKRKTAKDRLRRSRRSAFIGHWSIWGGRATSRATTCGRAGYCVSTVGLAEEVIRDYIQKQEADEKKQEKLELG